MRLFRSIALVTAIANFGAQADLLAAARPQIWSQTGDNPMLLVPQQDELVLMRQTKEGYAALGSLNVKTHGIHAMAMANIAGRTLPVFVTEQGIDVLTNAASLLPQRLIQLNHLYQGRQMQDALAAMQHIDFVFDLNHDGLSDMLLPDAQGLVLAIQQGNGGFHLQSVALPRHSHFTALSFESPSVSLSLPYAFVQADTKGDGRRDLLFVYADKVWALLMETTPANADSTFTLHSIASVADYVQQQEERLRFAALTDINGDSVPDLILYQTNIDKDTSQHLLVYPGQHNENALLSFRATAQGRIKVTGELVDVGFADFSGDGKAEAYTLATELGMGSLFSVISGGGLDMQIHMYLQTDDGQFKQTDSATQTTEFALDMQGLQFGTWFQAAPFITAKRHDLLYLADSQTLKLAVGHQQKGLAGKGKNLARAEHNRQHWFVTLDTDNDLVWELYLKEFEGKVLKNLQRVTIQP
ncbi:hypothetical protein [Bowmanella denitrificans]|uniref:hypothetical protein n=1 Tax=Bowmanella denitrificans TaxID=366582 RepID=UPI000C9B2EF9|nr:hypothetical protein [Bowmanella denitrificans]